MKHNLLKSLRYFTVLIMLVLNRQLHSQLAGNYFVPGNYPSIAAAVSDLNLQGVTGPVVINIQAGLLETAPVGGLVLTASGTAFNTITFQKSGVGPNPIINAYAGGVGTPGTAVQDGIWRFIGSDYITIDGIDLKDANGSNPATMEYGFGFFKASVTDGCQHNTIQNCAITLNNINNATGVGPAADGSRGINVVNALAGAQTSALSPTSSNGSNSNNLFYANTIVNCNVGIAIIGFAATSPFTLADTGNDIGGGSAATGNFIFNFGGAVGATNPAAGVRTLAQYNCNVSYNQLNNNNGSGSNHVTTLRGIYMNTATSANVTISNNLITINSAAVGAQVAAIENVAGATAANNTISISDNVIDNCSNLVNTTGSFYAIFNNAASGTFLNINNNLISNITTRASTGSNYLIYNTGAVSTAINFNSNSLINCNNVASTTGSYFSLFNNAVSTASFNANSNIINSISSVASQGSTQLIYNAANTDNGVSMSNNTISNCTHSISSTGAYYALYNNGISLANLNINGNSFSNHIITAANGPVHLLYNTRAIGNSIAINNNLISASTFSFSNSGTFYGIYNNAGSTNSLSINNNVFSGINSAVTSGSLHLIFNRGAITNTYVTELFNTNLVSSCIFSASAGGPFLGIYNSGVSTNLLSMTANTISSSSWVSTTSPRYMIYNSGQSFSSSDLSNNTMVSCSNTINTTGTYNGLLNTGATTLALNMSNSTFSNNINTGTSGGTYLMLNSGAVAGGIITMTNSLFTGISNSVSGTGDFYGIQNIGTTYSSLNISSSTFTNNQLVSASGTVNLINNTGAVSTSINSINLSNNLFSANSNTVNSSGSFFGIYNNAASAFSLTMSNNTFTNCNSVTSTGPSHMLYNRGALTNTFNTISVLNNVIGNCINTSTSSGQFYSIWNNGVTSTITAINTNTISNVNWNTLSGLRHLISNAGASAAAITITNNLLANCVSTLNTTGISFGINNTAISAGVLAITNNTFSNLSNGASTGDTYLIHNSGAQTASITLSDNLISNCTNSASTSGSFYQIYNNAAATSGLEMSRNTFTVINSFGATGSTYFIYNRGALTNTFGTMYMKDNLLSSCTGSVSSTGSFNGILNSGVSGTVLTVSGNSITANQLSSSTGAVNLIYNTAAVSNSISMSANLLSAFSNTGTSSGTFFGIVNSGASSAGDLSMVSNTLINLSSAASTGNRYLLFNNGGITNSISISNNQISSCNHSITGNGSYFLIHNNGASSAQSCSISNNTILNNFSSATSGATNLIYNLGVVTNTIGVVAMNNNLISGLTNSITAGGAFNGIFNSGYSSYQLSALTNSLTNVVCTSTSSTRQLIANSGKITGTLSINSNLISNYTSSVNTSGTFLGIYNNGVTNADLSISSNTLSNVILSSANANIHFIYNAGVVTNTLNTASFNSNLFTSFSNSISAGGIFYALFNNAFTSGILSMNTNTVSSGDLSTFSGARYMIYNTGPVINQFSANNNSISLISSTLNTSGNFYGINNAGNSAGDLSCISNTLSNLNLAASTGSLFGITNTGTVSNLCNISQNILSGITHSASGSGGFLGLYNSPASGTSLTSSLTINTNRLTNLNLISTSGTSNFIYNRGAISNTVSVMNINNNLISANTHSSGTGAFFAIYNSAITGGLLAMNSNSCTNLIATSTSANRHMVYNTGALLTALQMTNNLMSNFTSSLNTSGLMYDIYNAGNSAGDILIHSNTITDHTLSATSGSAYALYNTGVATNTTILSNNLISNINHSAAAAGGYLGVYNSPALGTSSSASLDISSNTFTNINLQSASGGANFIYNRGNTTNTISIATINSNVITACSQSATSGPFYVIYNNAITHGNLSILNNTCTNLIATSGTANRHFIYNTGNLLSNLKINNNLMSNFTSSLNTSGNFYAVYNAGNSAGDISIATNSISNQSLTASTGSAYAIYNTGVATNTVMIGFNLISALSHSANTSGGFLGVYHSPGLTTSNSASLSIISNTLNNLQVYSLNGGFNFIYCRGATTNTINNLAISSNMMSNTNYSTSTGIFYAVFNNAITTGSMTVLTNTCNQVVCTTTNSNRYMIYNTGPILNGLTINANQLSNFTSTLNTAGHFYGINNGGNSAGDLSITNNQLQNTLLSANTGSVYGVLNTGTVSNNMSVVNNTLSDLSFTASNVGGFIGIYHSPASGTSNSAGLDISSNTFSNTSLYLSTGGTNFLSTRGAVANQITSVSCNNNLIINVTHSVNSAPFYGFFNTSMTSGSLTVNSNSFTNIISTTSTSPRYFFNNAGPVSNALSINNNLVSNYTSTVNTTGLFYDIINTGNSAGKIDITNNTFSNQFIASTTASAAVIYNTGTGTNSITISGNAANGFNHQTPNAYFYGVYNGAASANISILSNTLTNVVSSTSTIPKYFFYNNANAGNLIQLNGNNLSNYTNTLNTTGSFYAVHNSGNSGGDINLNTNSISNISFASTTGSTYPVYNRGTLSNAANINNNLISNFTNTIGLSGLFYGINNTASNSSLLSITGNSITSLALYTPTLSTYLVLNSAASAVNINTINLNSNSISNYTINNSSGNFYGVYNNAISSNKASLSGNNFSNGVLTATSSNIYKVYNTGAVNTTLDLNTNLISALSNSLHVIGPFYGVYNTANAGDLNMNANSVNSSFLENTINDTYLICNSAPVSNGLNMNANLIASCTNSTLSTGSFYGVMNNGSSAASLSMNSNTFTNNYTSGTAGNTYLVFNAAAVSNSISLSANKLGYNFTNTLTNYSGDINAVTNTGTNALASISINANDFSNFNFTGQNGIGNLYFIQNTNDNVNLDISNNTWTNLNLKHNTNEYLISNSSNSSGLLSVTNNSIITAYNRSGFSGSLFIYTSGTLAAGTCTQVFTGNNFSNITAATPGTGSFYGIYSSDGGIAPYPKKTISNNVISNVNYAGLGFMYPYYGDYLGDANSATGSAIFSNTLSNITWTGPVYGISTGTNASALYATNIYSNVISVISSSASVSGSYGAFLNGSGAGLNFFKNKINDLNENSASGSVDGLHIESGSLVTISNNLIGNLYAPNSVSLNAVNGMNVVSAGTLNAFYNTVYLKASSTGSVFSTNAIYTNATTALNLRNNIFINLSTANANGITTAFRRNGTGLATYSTSSNNNLFYAGIPALNKVIYADGTNLYQTLTNFQTAVSPRESLSFSENTPFTSTVGTNPNFLHVNPLIPSLTESSVINIPGISTDYDNQVRQGNTGYIGTGTAPDCGADEYDQNLPPCASANAGTVSIPLSNIKCAGEEVFMLSTGSTPAGNLVHQWKVSSSAGGPYANVSGGVGPNYTAYTSGSLSAGTFYYVLVTTCTLGNIVSVSNEVTVTVHPVPTATAALQSASVCSGQNLNLLAGSNIATSYLWMGPNSFTSNLQNPSINNVVSNASGIYTLIVSDINCTATPVTVNATVHPTPPAFTLSPLSSSMCVGSVKTLSASIALTTPTLNFGSQSFQNPASGYPAPYSLYYGGQKMQMMILAGELLAAGFTVGTPINSIQFPVVSKGANWGISTNDCQNFQVNMKLTAANALLAFQAGLSNVVTASNYTPSIGYGNIHTFSAPFIWDGSSNLIIETVFSNNTIGSAGSAVIQYNSPTGFQSTLVYRADNQNLATIAAASASNVNVGFVRPDFKLNGVAVGTYSWGPSAGLLTNTGQSVSASPSLSTVYTASLSDGQCSSTASMQLNVILMPTVTIVSTSSMVCFGNSATLTANGAQTYTWSTSATATNIVVSPFTSTTYSVIGSNPACPNSTAIYSILALPALTLNVNSTPPALCVGSSATLNASGATSYSWNGSANASSIVVSPSITTNYAVLGSDGPGCNATKVLLVKVSPLPFITVTPVSATVCPEAEVSFDANGALTYTWSPGNSNLATLLVTPTVSSVYVVKGTDLNNCSNSATVTVTIDNCTGLDPLVKEFSEIKIYPNPSTGLVTLDFNENGLKSILVLNSQGARMIEINSRETRELINLSEFAKGVYFIKISGSINKSAKLIIE